MRTKIVKVADKDILIQDDVLTTTSSGLGEGKVVTYSNTENSRWSFTSVVAVGGT